MNDREKFELEMMATDELCYEAQVLKRETDELSAKMKLYGSSHPEYAGWKAAKQTKMRRRYWTLQHIKNRQKSLL